MAAEQALAILLIVLASLGVFPGPPVAVEPDGRAVAGLLAVASEDAACTGSTACAAVSLDGHATCYALQCTAVSVGGDATCSGLFCTVVSVEGNATGPFALTAVSGGGDATAPVAVSVDGNASGIVAVSLFGRSEGFLAVSGFGTSEGTIPVTPNGCWADPCIVIDDGHADAAVLAVGADHASAPLAIGGWSAEGLVAVAILGPAHGETIGASLGGDAVSPQNVAVSGMGEASSCGGPFVHCIALAPLGDATGSSAVSVVGNASGAGALIVASVTGDAESSDFCQPPLTCLAVSGTGRAEGTFAVSLTGRAEGSTAISGCNAVNTLCVDPI